MESDRFEIRTHFDEVKSLRAKVEELTRELAAAKDVPMKYKRMEYNAQLQKELAASQAREQQLRNALAEWATDETPQGWTAIKALTLPHDDTALIRACKLYAAEVLNNMIPIASGSFLSIAHILNFADQLRKEAER